MILTKNTELAVFILVSPPSHEAKRNAGGVRGRRIKGRVKS